MGHNLSLGVVELFCQGFPFSDAAAGSVAAGGNPSELSSFRVTKASAEGPSISS